MHLLLTDRLSCPRCGPRFGLVLLTERVMDRRVLAGSLGCPNCRDRFPVTAGFADLRIPPRGPLHPETPPPEPGQAEALRLAALLGVSEGPAHVALVGAVAAHAAALAALVAGLEAVAVGTELLGVPEQAGVSRLTARPGLPFRDAALQGVVLSGSADLLEEAARVTGPAGRVVWTDAPGTASGRAERAGLLVLLEEGGTLVAGRAGPRAPSAGRRLPVV